MSEGPRHPAPILLVLALRWLAFGWMLTVALVSGQIQRPVEAAIALLATGCWTAWLTVAAVRRMRLVLAADVAVAIALNVVYGHIYPPHAMLTNHPSFMGAYPAAAVAACGVVYRLRGGCAAGLVLGFSLPFAYAANEIALDRLSFLQVLTMIGGGLSYVLLGGTIGAAARQLNALHERATRDGQRAARMAERQRIVAQIHDDVLQQLGRLRAGIREMSGGPALDAVAEGIARQESALRSLGSAEPDPPPGVVSLHAQLAELVERYGDVPVRLITAGPFPLPTGMATEITAAVAELLTNVVKHAQAHQVWLTVLPDGGDITVTVRDDGVGFPPGQDTGGLGLRLSVQARVHRMAGSVRIRSSPGHGTEVELRVPKGNDHG
ncbi:signal transduction histidine kinase [Kibdelosporangium banguiense]|uniref:histidine kinase n=1 Tax=Kibdelosporangium banguiense TaxID=1365924 RepID=A0ABS4TVT0_9PSEU|nr:ATP-binding protein [Kibdelosporangium banguiense]MBP2328074.1 signal transduction histidine kinase [Kibdelosporangium banguiense]